MKVSCIQMDMAFAKPEDNFKKAVALVREAAEKKPDVILLPETWNVGFFPEENLEKLADQDGAMLKATFSPLAKELGVNIVAGSIANKKADGIYNTSYTFDREGNVVAEYDKTHLFSPMGEDKFFKKGNHTSTFTLDGLKCGVIICYDVRFPELIRTMSTKGLDVLFMVSQWPLVRVPHLDALTKARAIENQMFVVCCNSAGKAPGTVFGGNSSVTDPWGETIAHAKDKEEILYATLDPSILDGIRTSINVFADRRPDIYKVN
ncbi:MAG: carbon-nitrogen family hydrolase [Sphaerochaetaceae bacterium]|nr:carbon-nitrogen family hydrolase [Sphaerochaetaceae bacterium]